MHIAASPSKSYVTLLIFGASVFPSDLNRSHSRNFCVDFRLVNDALRAFAKSRYLQGGYKI